MRKILPALIAGVLLVASCDPTGEGGTTGTGTGGTGTTGPATKMIANTVTSQTAVAGDLVSAAPAVVVLDADGLGVTGVTVTFSVTSGQGSIFGTTVPTSSNGVASVGSWRLGTGLGTNTLTATVAGLTNSPITFTATGIAGPAAKLVVVDQPTSGIAGQDLAPAFVVKVQDAQGHAVAGSGTSITIAITSGSGTSGATMTGTKTRSTPAGDSLATFPGLKILKSGIDYTITATAPGLTSAVSPAFDITPGTVHKLFWTTQPTTVTAGTAITPSVTVAIQDTMGNAITASATISVGITAGTGAPGAVLNGTLIRSTVGGVASFPGLVINKPGAGYTLTATSAGLSNAGSTAFDILVGAPAKLVLTGGPASATAGQTLSALSVSIQDALGNPVPLTGANISAIITAGSGSVGATLAGTTVRATDVTGTSVFNDLSIAKSGSGYTLTFSAPSILGTLSVPFNITTGAAAQAVFTVQPVATVAGELFSPVPVVTIQDALGNTITTSSASVTLAITAGSGTPGALLVGTVTRGAVNGIATFSGLTINTAGASYSFTATTAGLGAAVSNAYDIVPADPAQLVLTATPASTSSGAILAPALTVGIQDAFGNTVVTAGIPVTVSITEGTGTAGAALAGTKTKLSTASGTVSFTDLAINKAGTAYSLTASSSGLVSGITPTFNITPGAAAVLSMTAQPASGSAGVTLTPSVAVTILDANGNTVTSAVNSITVGITAGTGTVGAVLSGTVTRAAVSGIATFPGLSINKSGTAYSLTATGTALTSAVGSAFDVSPGTGSVLVVTVQPTTVELGTVMAPAVKVEVRDALGNVVTASVDNVSVAVTTGSGTVVGVNVGGTTTQLPVAGVITYSDLTFDKDGTGFTLTVSAPGLTSAVSSAFTVTNANFIYYSRFNGATYDVWRTKLDGSSQSAITARSMVGDPAPAKNSANGRVAFSDGAYGIQQLYVMNGDGTVQQAVNTHSDAGEASWSPDGSTIATRVAAGSPSFGLFTIGGDGSNRNQLSGAVDNYPTWSPDGQSIALARAVSFHHQLATMPAVGGSAKVLLSTDDTSAANVILQLETDSLFGFLSDTGFVKFLAGQTSFGQTAWSPDGMRLLFVLSVGTESHIFAISNLGGGAVVALTNTVAAVDKAPTWSPDGTKILFQRTVAGVTRIYSMNANGSSVTQLPGQAGNNFSPSWWN